MTDPLSVSVAVLGIITAAAQATKLLHETVQQYKGRDKTLKKLDEVLKDMARILASLAEEQNIDAKLWELLKHPISRCSQVCSEFEESMKVFGSKTKTGLRDWTKLEFMKGDINNFMEQINGYKSTITIGLGIITMHNSKVSRHFLEEYMELAEDTTYCLKMQLQRIEEKLAQFAPQNASSDSSVDLRDERAVTKRCLRICEDAKAFIESLTNREASVLREMPKTAAADDYIQNAFGAQLETRRALEENRDKFAEIIGRLQQRLEAQIQEGCSGNPEERLRLQEDMNTSKQCLELCKVAAEISREKIHTVGEAIADDNSDQVVVTTVADLFDVKKAVSTRHSAQVVGSMTPENFQTLTEKRYNSRFGVSVAESGPAEAGASRPDSIPLSAGRADKSATPTTSREHSYKGRTDHARPSPNEVKKRLTKHDDQE